LHFTISDVTHRTLFFKMPATAAEAFDAFHNHSIRMRWDTLVKGATIRGGGDYPFVGAVTVNRGRDWKSAIAFDTRYVSFSPPKVAAAVIVVPTGIFQQWGASMHHRDLPNGESELKYTFTLHLRPKWLAFLFDGLAGLLYAWEMRRRFSAMRKYLLANKRS